MFRTLRLFQRTHGHCDVPPSSQKNSLYQWLKKQRQRHVESQLGSYQLKKLKSIGALQARHGNDEHYAEIFEDHFARLKRFKKQFGHCHVPMHWSEDAKLARWLVTQRQSYRKGQLPRERADRLAKLGVAWTLRGQDHQLFRTGSHYQEYEQWWDEHFKNLQQWKSNNYFVPIGEDETLRRWTITQRTDYRKGKLRADRRQRLEKIGFPWELQTVRDAKWDAMFARLVAFKKRFGHPQVPLTWTENPKLAGWVGAQRGIHDAGKMRADRYERLTKIGLSWNVAKEVDRTALRLAGSHYQEREDLWEKRFKALGKWKNKQSELTIQTDFSVYRWLVRQRKAHRDGLMRADRQKRLEKLGFPMEAPDFKEPKWEKQLEELIAFKKRFGHFHVRKTQHRELCDWVDRQRRRYQSGRLLPHRRRKLEAIGFTWTLENEEIWNRMFAELRQWKKRHFKVPAAVQPLQSWLKQQRRMHRAGSLSKDRYRRLKEIGFPFEV